MQNEIPDRWKRHHQIMVGNLMLAVFLVTLFIYGAHGVENVGGVEMFNVGYSLIALLSSVVLYSCCALDGMQKDVDRRRFMALIFVNFLAMAFDGVSYFWSGEASYRFATTFVMAFAFAFDCIIAYLVLEYLVSMLSLREEKAVRLWRILSGIGAVLGILSALSNFFIPLYFVVDEDGVYRHTATYDLNFFYPAAVAYLITGLAIVYRKRLNKKQLIAALTYTGASLSLTVIARFFSRFYINYAVMFLFLLIIYMLLNMEGGNKGAVTEKELATAKKIQDSMLPNLFPDYVDVPEFDIFTMLLPAREVGGDYYDFFMLDDHRFVFLLGDVSGKGVGAALFMAVSKSMINMRTQLGGTPAEILTGVNQRIAETNDQAMFAGVWLGILDIRTGHLVYCNAGQSMPAFLIRNRSEEFVFQNVTIDPPVGAMEGVTYVDEELYLQPGDRIFLYTDGIPETRGRSRSHFGYKRLLAVLNGHRDAKNEELCFAVLDGVTEFLGDAVQQDDITMLGFTYKGVANEGT